VAALVKPSKAAFYAPAFGDNFESVQFIAFSHRLAQGLLSGLGEGFAGIACIGEQGFYVS